MTIYLNICKYSLIGQKQEIFILTFVLKFTFHIVQCLKWTFNNESSLVVNKSICKLEAKSVK